MLPHKCVHFDHPVQWGNHLKLACQHSESTLYIRQDCDPQQPWKSFQMGFGNSGQQRGQHQRLVLTQMGNQLQAGGQVLKDCLIQCRCCRLPYDNIIINHHNNIIHMIVFNDRTQATLESHIQHFKHHDKNRNIIKKLVFSDGTQATSSTLLASLSPLMSDLLSEVKTI